MRCRSTRCSVAAVGARPRPPRPQDPEVRLSTSVDVRGRVIARAARSGHVDIERIGQRTARPSETSSSRSPAGSRVVRPSSRPERIPAGRGWSAAAASAPRAPPPPGEGHGYASSSPSTVALHAPGPHGQQRDSGEVRRPPPWKAARYRRADPMLRGARLMQLAAGASRPLARAGAPHHGNPAPARGPAPPARPATGRLLLPPQRLVARTWTRGQRGQSAGGGGGRADASTSGRRAPAAAKWKPAARCRSWRAGRRGRLTLAGWCPRGR